MTAARNQKGKTTSSRAAASEPSCAPPPALGSINRLRMKRLYLCPCRFMGTVDRSTDARASIGWWLGQKRLARGDDGACLCVVVCFAGDSYIDARRDGCVRVVRNGPAGSFLCLLSVVHRLWTVDPRRLLFSSMRESSTSSSRRPMHCSSIEILTQPRTATHIRNQPID